MAIRFCSSTGSNTSPYDTWAKAATTFANVITGSANGDILVIDADNPPTPVTGLTLWTFVANCSVVASTNSGTTTVTPTVMTSAYLGSSVSGASITLQAAFKVYFYGVRVSAEAAGSRTDVTLNLTDGGHFEFEDCTIRLNATTASIFNVGGASAGRNTYTKFKNCTYLFNSTGSNLALCSGVDFIGGTMAPTGAAPTSLISGTLNTTYVRFVGTNLSAITGTLVASQSGSTVIFEFAQCRFGAGVTVMATQSPANKSSAQVSVFDCSSGSTNGLIGYYDAFGSVTSDTGIYLTAGASAQSWKVVTTANCSFGTPFVTPWVNVYNTSTATITPYLEILRNGSTTPYTNAQVWGEFSVKDNSGFTNSDTFDDRQPLAAWAAGTAGTSQPTGAGTGAWTGGTTPWSGKVDSGVAVTPAEPGHIRARVMVGAPSITVYVDPQIRT